MILTADFHSHILPGIDDGAQTVDESLKMLDMMGQPFEDGSHYVVATPHFKYHNVDDDLINQYISDRNISFAKLKSADAKKSKNIILGSEVALGRALTECNNLDKLVMGSSNIIMLEMPFQPYKPWMYEVVEKVRYTYKLTPMIAHFERYASLYRREDYAELFEFPDAIFQFNASSLKVRKLRKLIISAIESGLPVVMGSDCHDTKSRIPDYHDGMHILDKKLDEEAFYYFRNMSENIIMEMK